MAAILFIASVSAARGRVTVRARAQLRRSPRPTATSAATPRATCSAESGRSASVRERSTRTRGPAPLHPAPRAARRALRPPGRPSPPPRPWRPPAVPRPGRRGSVEAKTRPSIATATWLPVSARRRAANASSRANPSTRWPRASVSRTIGAPTVSRSRPPSTRKGRATSVQPAASAPSETSVLPLAVRQHEHVRAHPVAVVPRDGLGGAGVALGDRGLELGQVGHERGALLRRLEPGPVGLHDEARRLRERARELRLGLLGHPARGEAEGQGGGQDGHERGGREDARAERAQGSCHHSTVKSCGATSPGAATRTSRRARTWPSFQTASV